MNLIKGATEIIFSHTKMHLSVTIKPNALRYYKRLYLKIISFTMILEIMYSLLVNHFNLCEKET